MENLFSFFQNLCHMFEVPGVVERYTCMKEGNINDTYTLHVKENNTEKSYIAQRINHNVFKKPYQVMENIESVTRHIRRKLAETNETDIVRKVVRLYHRADGNPLYIDEKGNYWRVTSCIYNAKSSDERDERVLYNAGCGFNVNNQASSNNFYLTDVHPNYKAHRVIGSRLTGYISSH